MTSYEFTLLPAMNAAKCVAVYPAPCKQIPGIDAVHHGTANAAELYLIKFNMCSGMYVVCAVVGPAS